MNKQLIFALIVLTTIALSACFTPPTPTAVCGNGILETGEECDQAQNNNIPCSPPYGETCTYCNADCENTTLTNEQFCGNQICEPQENTTTCPEDCTTGLSTNTIIEAESGVLAGMTTGTTTGIEYIYTTTDDTGTAIYTFNVPTTGQYILEAKVNAQTSGTNSFFVSIDGQEDIYDMQIPLSFEWDQVSWRGTGTDLQNEFNPKIFQLTAGSHTVTIRGREKNTQLDQIKLSTYETTQVCTTGQTQPCQTGLQGICALGTRTCTNNAWGTCVQNQQPTTEICGNGIDEDCNGADLPCQTGTGITYYVSNTGSDSNNGLSESTPWKTLSKVNSIMSNLQPGDSVLLKRGDEWRETLSVTKSGAANKHITFGAYGTGNKPKITGSDKISSWTVHSGNVWKATVTGQPYWIILIQTNGTITWAKKENSLAGVASDKEFYCTSTTCYLYSTTDPDTAYNSIEGTYRNGIESTRNYLKFDGLDVRFMTWEGIRGTNVDNWIIQNMEIHHVGDDQDIEGQGILYQGSNGLIRNNKIYETGQHGIYLALYNNEPQPVINNIIEHNEIFNQYHTGIDVMNLALDSSSNKLHSNNTVRYNYVYQTPGHYGVQVGIQFQGSSTTNSWVNNSKIYYNIVKDISSNGILSSWRNDNIEISNNLVINAKTGGIGLANPYNNKVTVKNNIVKQGTGGYSIFVGDTTGKTINNNIYYDQPAGYQFAYINGQGYATFSAYRTATGLDANSYFQDPMFTNFAAGDYHPQAGSVAIDNGAATGIPFDYEGNTVPQGVTDIGIYETTTTGGSQTGNAWYVDNAASAGGNGLTWNTAWNSFSGIQWSSIQPGDTIYISGGTTSKTYTEELRPAKSGTSSGGHITITKGTTPGHNGMVLLTGNGVYIRPQKYLKISKLNLTDGAQLYVSGSSGSTYSESGASSNIILEDNYVHIMNHGGVFIQTSDHITVRRNYMTTPDWTTIQTDGIYSQKNRNNTYEYNTIIISNAEPNGHNDGIQSFMDMDMKYRYNYIEQNNTKSAGNAQGIYITTSNGTLWIYGNVLWGPYTKNPLITNSNYFGSIGTAYIYGNTVVGGGWGVVAVKDSPNSMIKNNIIACYKPSVVLPRIDGVPTPPQNWDYNLYYAPNSNLFFNNNINTFAQWQAAGYDVHGRYGDPQFLDRLNRNFKVQATSPAVNNGFALGTPYNYDKEGILRPQGAAWDIGAYER